MAGLDPAIHVFVFRRKQDVDHRDEPGDDSGRGRITSTYAQGRFGGLQARHSSQRAKAGRNSRFLPTNASCFFKKMAALESLIDSISAK
jgi:hypothetical protein